MRILGKYAGAAAGALLTGEDKNVRRYLGLALVPQAGVSIGLAALGERILSPEMGALLSTVILSSAVLYELAGPACAKLALSRAHVLTPAQLKDKPETPPHEAHGSRLCDGSYDAPPKGEKSGRPVTGGALLSCHKGGPIK